MAARDGDGWIECACGFKHWGKFGAAGLLIIRDGAILLQHRAPWVHNGDTWGIPGGARDSHETIIEGAIREAVEETGINPADLQAVHTFTDDHEVWSYSTVIAIANENLEGHELNDRLQAAEGRPDAETGETVLSDWRIDHTSGAEFLEQPLAYLVGALVLSDFLAHQEHLAVLAHFLGHGITQGFAHGHGDHFGSGGNFSRRIITLMRRDRRRCCCDSRRCHRAGFSMTMLMGQNYPG